VICYALKLGDVKAVLAPLVDSLSVVVLQSSVDVPLPTHKARAVAARRAYEILVIFQT
jgi:hypothetical protein